MKRFEIDAAAQTDAPVDVVYALLRDGSTWPQWSSIDSFEPEGDGPEGVGAVRIFRSGRYTIRERILELVPDRRFSYGILSGLPVRDYRADIDLEPSGPGTKIRWRVSYSSKLPGLGWLLQRRFTALTERFAQSLAAHASAG
jgi:carbon monoxide dehydrogenase subunit G